MGLKTKNYVVEKIGIVLPEAYAVVKKITAERGNATAIIAVSTNRENAIEKVPLEEIRINFSYDIGKDNIIEKAYEIAKSQKTIREYNGDTDQIEDKVVKMPFFGWENDITQTK